MRFAFLFVFFAYGCEQKLTENESCSLQGLHFLVSKNLSCKSDLKISNVLFSTGSTYHLIQGEVNLNQEDYPFSILVDSTTILEHTFPLSLLDSNVYDCKVNYSKSNFIEIEWTRNGNRLALKKKATSRN